MECSDDGTLSERMYCILSYAGSTDDIALNYTLLVISTCAAYFLLKQYSNSMSTSFASINRSSSYQSDAFVALLGVVGFQIGLCLVLGCSGVSIIWVSERMSVYFLFLLLVHIYGDHNFHISIYLPSRLFSLVVANSIPTPSKTRKIFTF